MNHYPSTDLKFLTDFLFDGMAEVVGGGNSHFWFKQDMHIDTDHVRFPTADVMHAAHFRKSGVISRIVSLSATAASTRTSLVERMICSAALMMKPTTTRDAIGSMIGGRPYLMPSNVSKTLSETYTSLRVSQRIGD